MGYLRWYNQRYSVRFLLDRGIQATLLREGIIPRMADSDSYLDYLIRVGGSKIKKKLRVLDCHIEDVDGKWSYPINLTEIDKPCSDVPIKQHEQLQHYFFDGYLSDIDIHDAPSETIDILRGVDNTHLMVCEEYVRGDRSDEPVAVKCPFGWFIQGGRAASSVSLLNYLNISAVGSLEEYIGIETAGLEFRRCKCVTYMLDRSATANFQYICRQATTVP